MTKSLDQFTRLVDVGLNSDFAEANCLSAQGRAAAQGKCDSPLVFSSPLRVLRGSKKGVLRGPSRDFAERSFLSVTRFRRETPRTGVQTFRSCSTLSGLPEISTEPDFFRGKMIFDRGFTAAQEDDSILCSPDTLPPSISAGFLSAGMDFSPKMALPASALQIFKRCKQVQDQHCRVSQQCRVDELNRIVWAVDA